MLTGRPVEIGAHASSGALPPCPSRSARVLRDCLRNRTPVPALRLVDWLDDRLASIRYVVHHRLAPRPGIWGQGLPCTQRSLRQLWRRRALHPPAKEAALKHLHGTLNSLWGIQWEHQPKDPFWRPSVNGVPLLGNSHIRGQAPEVCGCGGVGGTQDWGRQARQHLFWDCLVARAVVESVQDGWPAGEGIRKEQVWLIGAP